MSISRRALLGACGPLLALALLPASARAAALESTNVTLPIAAPVAPLLERMGPSLARPGVHLPVPRTLGDSRGEHRLARTHTIPLRLHLR